MIRLCDKEIYTIGLEQTEDMNFDDFFEANPEAVIGVVDSVSDEFLFVIYKYVDEVRCEKASSGKVVIVDDFWNVCRRVLRQGECRLVSVYSKSNELIGFAYEDNTSDELLEALKELAASPHTEAILRKMYPGIEQMYIWGCNEAAYYLLLAVQKTDIVCTLLGEEWAWFGYSVMQHFGERMASRSCYVMAEGVGYHCENRNNGVSIYPAITTLPLFVLIYAAAYSIALSMSENYLKNRGIPYAEVILPSSQSVKKYATELERESIECNCVPPYNYISQRIKGAYSGNEYHERLLWNAYGKANLDALIAEGSDYGNREKIRIDNPYVSLTKIKSGLHRVYVVGRCIVFGMGCVTTDQFVSRLQRQIDQENLDYEVVAVGISAAMLWKTEEVIKSLPIRKGDLLLFIDEDIVESIYDLSRVQDNPLMEIYKKSPRGDYFFACPIHSTPKGNEALAEFVFERCIAPVLHRTNEFGNACTYLQNGEVVSEKLNWEIQKYIQRIKAGGHSPSGKVGAIVMNANPFTKGHLYLAEYAAGMVDGLYIFVVEEDRSDISFEKRFEFVRHGVRHIKNAIVVPSGSMIISARTLAVYFEKENIQEETIDAGYDIEIFARYIAPAFNISMRFVGEEPTDRVTAQYNEQMKQILPEFGIKLIEIPRKKNADGEVISAGRLRKLLKNGNYKEAQEYVDDWELERLKEIWNRKENG